MASPKVALRAGPTTPGLPAEARRRSSAATSTHTTPACHAAAWRAKTAPPARRTVLLAAHDPLPPHDAIMGSRALCWAREGVLHWHQPAMGSDTRFASTQPHDTLSHNMLLLLSLCTTHVRHARTRSFDSARRFQMVSAAAHAHSADCDAPKKASSKKTNRFGRWGYAHTHESHAGAQTSAYHAEPHRRDRLAGRAGCASPSAFLRSNLPLVVTQLGPVPRAG